MSMLRAAVFWKIEEHEICANISWSFPFYLKYNFCSFNMEGDWMKENWNMKLKQKLFEEIILVFHHL